MDTSSPTWRNARQYMSHVKWMNESCHMNNWVMSHMDKSSPLWMNELCHAWISHVTLQVRSRERPPTRNTREYMSHVTWMNASLHMHKWVMSHIDESSLLWMNESGHVWISHVTLQVRSRGRPPSCNTREYMSHVTWMNASLHMHKWVMSHIDESSLLWMNESCRVWISHVTPQIWSRRRPPSRNTREYMSHVTWMNVSRHMHEWVMSHIDKSSPIWTNESCRVWMSHVTPQIRSRGRPPSRNTRHHSFARPRARDLFHQSAHW